MYIPDAREANNTVAQECSLVPQAGMDLAGVHLAGVHLAGFQALSCRCALDYMKQDTKWIPYYLHNKPSAYIFSTSPGPGHILETGLLQETGLVIFPPPGTCTLPIIFHYISSTKLPSRYWDCSFVLPGTLSESEF